MRLGDRNAARKKENADWFGWSLQFMAGVFIGSLLGFAFGFRRLSNWWLTDPAAAIALLCGSALLCGGQASLRGDRFWYGAGFRVRSAADRIRQSETSRHASILISVVGALGIAGALIWHILR
jgi:hypothetical protein